MARTIGLLLLVGALGFAAWSLFGEPRDEGAIDVIASREESAAPPVETPAPLPLRAPAEPEPLAEMPAAVEVLVVGAPDLATGEELVVSVRHADESLASEAWVVLFSADDVLLGQGPLDAQGSWRHAGSDGAASLFVRGATRVVQRFELEIARGAHDFVLPEGAWLRGKVTVDGEPPGRPLLIGFDPAPPAPWPTGPVAPTRLFIAGEPMSSREDGFFTRPDGSFRLSGFEFGEELRLVPARFYDLVVEASTPQPLRAPHDSVELVLRRWPMLRGRILGEDGAPEPKASLSLFIEMAYDDELPASLEDMHFGTSFSMDQVTLDEQARFSMPLGDLAAAFTRSGGPVNQQALYRQRAKVSARTADGAWLEAVTGDLDFTQDHDMGDLQLNAKRVLSFRLHDRQGAPISDGKLRLEVSEEAAEPALVGKSNSEGLLKLDVSHAEFGVATALAEGYAARHVDLQGWQTGDVVDVLLERDTSLRIRLHGEWDDAAWAAKRSTRDWTFRYRVGGAGPVYQDALLARRFHDGARGPDVLRGSIPDVFSSADSFEPDGSVRIDRTSSAPEILLSGLRPHHPILLAAGLGAVPDALGPRPSGMIWKEEVWLEVGEQRVLDVDLSGWRAQR